MAIQSLRLPNGEEVTFDEWSHWPRYSTIDVAAASAGNFSLSAFSYVVGGRVPAAGVAPRLATPTDTNQLAKKRMNHDEAFLAFAWTYEIFATSDWTISGQNLAVAPIFESKNLRRLQRDVVFSFMVGAQVNKPVARAPMSWIGQGPGSPGYGSGTAVAAGTSVNYGTGGRATPSNQRTWNMPIHVESDRVMSVDVRALRAPGVGSTPALDAVTQSFSLRVILDGLHRRNIG